MAFGSLSDIQKQITSALNDAFGIGNSAETPNHAALFQKEYFGSGELDPSKWTGNSYAGSGRKPLRYGFAIMKSAGTAGLKLSDSKTEIYFLQIPPQAIQQREIFATNVQATRKGVTVESEGVVFKDIIISGTTGIFPGERASGQNPIPNLNVFAPPHPPAGVDPQTGKSQRSEVTTFSGYEEFLSLRQFFLKYASMKVKNKGQYFFGFLNQKDNQYLIVEPLEFTMERNARSPMTYDYRIVLKAIGSIDDTIKVGTDSSEIGILKSVVNLSANISATLAASKVIIDQSTGLLVSITQALDDIVITPFRQLKLAVDALTSGVSTVLTLPSTLASNFKGASKITLAVAEQRNSINSSTNNFAVGQRAAALGAISTAASALALDDFGNVTSTGAATAQGSSNSASLASTTQSSILNADGSLSTTLTSAQYTQVVAIINQLDNDTLTPVPRSFVETLRDNILSLRNDLADSVGLGSTVYNSIQGRTVTHPAPALAVPTDDQFELLATLQTVASALNKILSNNEFFQSGVDGIYNRAQVTYGSISPIIKPISVKEIQIQFGDSLEAIALREYGNALRWVDLVVLNNLRAPYIMNEVSTVRVEGVKMPGDTLLIGEQ